MKLEATSKDGNEIRGGGDKFHGISKKSNLKSAFQ